MISKETISENKEIDDELSDDETILDSDEEDNSENELEEEVTTN